MTPDLVSTIIPVYNRADALREAVASVLAQDWRAIEVLIVDDGSTDQTFAVAQELAAQYPDVVRVYGQSNAGPGAARETGRLLARGEFIQYLDSDDLLLPRKFALQVKALRESPHAGICYGLTMDGNLDVPTHGTDVARDCLYPALFHGRIWHTVSPLYRRTVTDAIGPWNKRRILEDWDYDLRAGLLGTKLQYCSEPLATVWDRGDEHAGLLWTQNAQAMRDRIAAYAGALEFAQRAGIPMQTAELRHLLRSIFWISREAARHGFIPEANHMLQLAQTHDVARAPEYYTFRAMVKLLGWRRTLAVSERVATLFNRQGWSA